MKSDQLARHGERNGRARLTAESVSEIRAAVRTRDKFRREAKRLREQARRMEEAALLLGNAALARRHGVTEGTVRAALYGGSWKHVR